MKYVQTLLLALLGTGNAIASCLDVTITSDFVDFHYDGEVANFGIYNGIYDDSPSATKASIEIYNDCEANVSDLTISISGNAGEFCLDQFQQDCPTLVGPTNLVETGTSGPIDLYFRPLHPGKKKKRLSIDAVSDGNDVSTVITILGETEPRPKAGQ